MIRKFALIAAFVVASVGFAAAPAQAASCGLQYSRTGFGGIGGGVKYRFLGGDYGRERIRIVWGFTNSVSTYYPPTRTWVGPRKTPLHNVQGWSGNVACWVDDV